MRSRRRWQSLSRNGGIIMADVIIYSIRRQIDLADKLEQMHKEALAFLNEGDYEGYQDKMQYINELGRFLPIYEPAG